MAQNKVKWGVIGAGGIADRRTIPGMMLAKNAELVAVMEVNMELAEKLRAKYCLLYTSGAVIGIGIPGVILAGGLANYLRRRHS